MGTVYQQITPEGARFLTTTFPQHVVRTTGGVAFPVSSLGYDASSDEAATWKLVATRYGSGNLTLDIYWYALGVTTGDVVWGASIAAITANTDSQDLETKAFATENTVTDSHLGTVQKRVHQCAVTISNLDSLAADDIVWLRIRRVGSSGSDTMTVDANFLYARLSYSDT